MTRDSKLHTLYGLKFNPFLPDLPLEALYVPAPLESFLQRCENHVAEGGFAMLTGVPGLGKSSAMRLLETRLSRTRDVLVRSLTYPQCRIGDFYRELGDAFGVSLTWSNRWGSFKMVRDKWAAHLETTRMRPVLFIDECQQMLPTVLHELRLLTSKDFDSRSLLFVVFAGDLRFAETLRSPELLPLDSRMRTRVRLEPASVAELTECLRHVLDKAGNAQLLTPGAVAALTEHAAGNARTLMGMGNDLLHAAVARDARQIDEKLFFDVFSTLPPRADSKRRR
jgi:type II secretory pathway predicted ATPase ExeA